MTFTTTLIRVNALLVVDTTNLQCVVDCRDQSRRMHGAVRAVPCRACVCKYVIEPRLTLKARQWPSNLDPPDTRSSQCADWPIRIILDWVFELWDCTLAHSRQIRLSETLSHCSQPISWIVAYTHDTKCQLNKQTVQKEPKLTQKPG